MSTVTRELMPFGAVLLTVVCAEHPPQILGALPGPSAVEPGPVQEHDLPWLVHGSYSAMGPLCEHAEPPVRPLRVGSLCADHAYNELEQVPVRVDYSDLYDVLAFFDGGVDAARSGNHDDLAEEIALAGADWARKHWRIEDMRVCKALLAPSDVHSLGAPLLTFKRARRHAPLAARMGARIRPGQGD